MSTYRERREQKAERLREWSASREAKSAAAYEGVQEICDRIPFGQPIIVGHHSERGARADQRRIERGMDRSLEHAAKATDMASRADGIDQQLRTSIYSDDPDAIERLEAKVAVLEARLAHIKTTNAAFRKDHRAELKALTAYQREMALPFRSYELTNGGATLRQARKRLEQLRNPRPQRDRLIVSRYGGSCADCGAGIERGQTIRYSKTAGARCQVCAVSSEA